MTPAAETAGRVMKKIKAFEDSDDVQQVFNNLELTDEVMAQLK